MMMDTKINYFEKIIENSNITTITYDSNSDELLHNILFNMNTYYVDDYIDNYFNLISFLRDKKIDSILSNDNTNIKYIIFNTINTIYSIENNNSRVSQIFDADILDNLIIQARDINCKLILISPKYDTLAKDIPLKLRRCVYQSDLFLNVSNLVVSSIKNKCSSSFDIFSLID